MSRIDHTRLLPSHITIPDCNSYQVRIVRSGVEQSKSFSFSGNPARALALAVAWRDQLLAVVGIAGNDLGEFRTVPLSHKKSGCPVGVTCYLRKDKRRNSRKEYLVYGVHFKLGGKSTTKSFQVGDINVVTTAQCEQASATALAFRQAYVLASKQGTTLNLEDWINWRNL